MTRAATETLGTRSLSGRDRGRIQALVLFLAAALSVYVIAGLLAPFRDLGGAGPILVALAISVMEMVRVVVYEELEALS